MPGKSLLKAFSSSPASAVVHAVSSSSAKSKVDLDSPASMVGIVSPVQEAASIAQGEIELPSFDFIDRWENKAESFFEMLWKRLVFILETLGGFGVFAVLLVIIALARNPELFAFMLI